MGSHTVALLLDKGFDVTVVDNYSNSLVEAEGAIERVASARPEFCRLDIRETDELQRIMARVEPEVIIHFAGMKHVGESTQLPQEYYDCNVGGMLSLLTAARETDTRKIVFSSSGSVYGETNQLPIPEKRPHAPTNPYSTTKSVCERILSDLCTADESWSAVALRYFNPAGAHPSGLLGEWCVGPPSNLLPRVIEAAACEDPEDRKMVIHGDDFDTPDGTGVRDYVHVQDVADAHVRAIEVLNQPGLPSGGFEALNIGRGQGVSVRELIVAVEQASGRELSIEVGPRRPGDVSALYGDTSLARDRLGLVDYRGLDQICQDAWRFKSMHPNGYT